MSHHFESGFFVRDKAWHGLGRVLENAPTDTAEAIHAAGLDWKVETQPVYAENNNYALDGGDSDESEAMEQTDDVPLAILPDDEYDGVFAELDGSLLDELLTV